jgi:acetoin utilization deacetylase AcuC-like enzyme
MARRARGLSDRVAVVLEGGYTLETLPGFVRAVAEVF